MIAAPSLPELMRATCCQVLGENKAKTIEKPSMGGEDFAFYTQHVPAAFVRVGSAGAGTSNLPLHNSGFDIDEAVLPVGAQILSSCAVNYLTGS